MLLGVDKEFGEFEKWKLKMPLVGGSVPTLWCARVTSDAYEPTVQSAQVGSMKQGL